MRAGETARASHCAAGGVARWCKAAGPGLGWKLLWRPRRGRACASAATYFGRRSAGASRVQERHWSRMRSRCSEKWSETTCGGTEDEGGGLEGGSQAARRDAGSGPPVPANGGTRGWAARADAVALKRSSERDQTGECVNASGVQLETGRAYVVPSAEGSLRGSRGGQRQGSRAAAEGGGLAEGRSEGRSRCRERAHLLEARGRVAQLAEHRVANREEAQLGVVLLAGTARGGTSDDHNPRYFYPPLIPAGLSDARLTGSGQQTRPRTAQRRGRHHAATSALLGG